MGGKGGEAFVLPASPCCCAGWQLEEEQGPVSLLHRPCKVTGAPTQSSWFASVGVSQRPCPCGLGAVPQWGREGDQRGPGVMGSKEWREHTHWGLARGDAVCPGHVQGHEPPAPHTPAPVPGPVNPVLLLAVLVRGCVHSGLQGAPHSLLLRVTGPQHLGPLLQWVS